MEEAPEAIVEEREEPVFCLVNGTEQSPKPCHFLRPSPPKCDGAALPDPPRLPTRLSSLFERQSKKLPLNIKWRRRWFAAGDSWVQWVNLMEPLHHATWKKAGIFEAIKCSTYQFIMDCQLLIALAEKWCPDTKTFVFSWGEASITLEDVYVLGAYSVLGSPVFASVEDGEMKETERKMKSARLEISRGTARCAACSHWMKMFKGSKSDIEHEAFLAFWLTKVVFPKSGRAIHQNVLPIAVHLARGNKIALAPAVLAGIYRDLNLLEKGVRGLAASVGGDENKGGCSAITLWAPCSLVQIWAWERFIFLRPMPKMIRLEESRMSQWDKVRNLKLKEVHNILDKNGCFEWRPYVKEMENFKYPSFYDEKGRWEMLDRGDVKEEIWLFARCLVSCELVGLECIEQYLPHRVAKQFGMDQDIPDHVARCNKNPTVAWRSYDVSFRNSSLYVPPRDYKPCVTKRYHDWYSSRPLEGSVKRLKEAEKGKDNSVPPGFHPVPKYVPLGKPNYDEDDDHLTLSQLHSKKRKHDVESSRASDCGGNISNNNRGAVTSQNPSSRKAASGIDEAVDEELIRVSILSDPGPKGEERVVEDNEIPAMELMSKQEIPGRNVRRSQSTLAVDMLELELTGHVSELERDVAALKASRLRRRQMALQKLNK